LSSISILAEPPVTIIDKNVDKHGVRDIAEAYLRFLYTDQGQELCAKHYYRPSSANVKTRYKDQFTDLQLFRIDSVFGGCEISIN
jgi:sulfate transport system substrate-binding protein